METYISLRLAIANTQQIFAEVGRELKVSRVREWIRKHEIAVVRPSFCDKSISNSDATLLYAVARCHRDYGRGHEVTPYEIACEIRGERRSLDYWLDTLPREGLSAWDLRDRINHLGYRLYTPGFFCKLGLPSERDQGWFSKEECQFWLKKRYYQMAWCKADPTPMKSAIAEDAIVIHELRKIPRVAITRKALLQMLAKVSKKPIKSNQLDRWCSIIQIAPKLKGGRRVYTPQDVRKILIVARYSQQLQAGARMDRQKLARYLKNPSELFVKTA